VDHGVVHAVVGLGLRVEDLWHGIVAAIVISLINWVFGIILRPQTKRR
jgi:putative membrane protein